jgi:hypothetical protein
VAIIEQHRNQTWDTGGNLIADQVVDVDVTEAAITLDLHAKARTALQANADYLALASPTNAQNLAQIRRLTRECSAIIRLLIGSDLLVENADT